jgi:hypothetical protein
MIGLILLLVCIILALVGKHIFDLEGDFLSAAATLFAAVVAMLLFNDWREQQKFALIEKYQDLLKEAGNSLFLNYSKFHIRVKTVRNQYAFPATEAEKNQFIKMDTLEVRDLVQGLLTDLLHSSTLLHEYSICMLRVNSEYSNSIHYKDIMRYRDNLCNSYKQLADINDDEVLRYTFELANLADKGEIASSIHQFKELCGYSCVEFLNNLLLDNK